MLSLDENQAAERAITFLTPLLGLFLGLSCPSSCRQVIRLSARLLRLSKMAHRDVPSSTAEHLRYFHLQQLLQL